MLYIILHGGRRRARARLPTPDLCHYFHTYHYYYYYYDYYYCFYCHAHTASFHNFKSQNFKLSVSNPKNKYVVYLSVLSLISNCQGLGRKNKHDILKTDCTDSACTRTAYTNSDNDNSNRNGNNHTNNTHARTN